MTREELRSALKIQSRIDRVNNQINTLRETGGVGGASSNDPVTGGEKIGAGQTLVELQDEVKELQEKLKVEQIIVKRYLDKVEFEPLHRKLMELRYVDCLKWEEVAEKICYSVRYTKGIGSICEKRALGSIPHHL